MRRSLISLAVAVLVGAADAGMAQDADPDAPAPEIPVCMQSLGALRIAEGDRAGWADLDLPAPSALLRAIVQRSHCFTLTDRPAEAGYVLIAELDGQREPAQPSVTQFVGAIVDARWSGLVADANTDRHGPQAVLTLMQVGSAARVAETRGRGFAQDPNWAPGAQLRLGAPARSWEENEIGRMMSGAYIDAFAQLVTQLGGLDSAAPALTGALRTRRSANLRTGPGTEQSLVRRLDAGAELTSTGATHGAWLQVVDVDGDEGWIRNDLVEQAR